MSEKKEFNATAYKNEFIRQNYDTFRLTMPKGMKDQLKDQAAQHGMSLNAYLMDIISNHVTIKDYAINTDGLEKK